MTTIRFVVLALVILVSACGPSPEQIQLSVELNPAPTATSTPTQQPPPTATSTPTQRPSPTATSSPTQRPSPTATSSPKARPVQFHASDCQCLGLPQDPHAPPAVTAGGLVCNYAWPVQVGNSQDTNQVQTEMVPSVTFDKAKQWLAGEAEQLSSLGGENSTSSDVSLINIQKKGNAGFYYGEARHVFEQGYIISTHLRGYYSSGDEVISRLQKSFKCMDAAIGANPGP